MGIFLVLAGTPETLIFRFIWQMGGPRCVQDAPTGCGNDLLILLRNMTSDNKCKSWYSTCIVLCVFKPRLPCMFETKCYRQNDRTDHGIFSWFSWNSDFEIVFTSQVDDFHAKPTFSIVCIISIFLCCNIYMYAYVFVTRTGSNLGFHSIPEFRFKNSRILEFWVFGIFQNSRIPIPGFLGVEFWNSPEFQNSRILK